MRYAMAIDTRKCVGCSDCVVACQTENDVPVGFCRDWVKEVVDGTYPNVSIELRSERCNHCANSPCVRCCPTGASHFEEGGIVLVEHKQMHRLRRLHRVMPLRSEVFTSGRICRQVYFLHPQGTPGIRPCLRERLPDQMYVFRRFGRSEFQTGERAEEPQIQVTGP